MTCTEFIEAFSEVHDGTAPADVVLRAGEHAQSCASCRRYRSVVERGAALLRSLPEPEIHQDFAPLLRRRLAYVEQDAFLRGHTNSGSTALAVLGMAAVLVAVAWAPLMRPPAPAVELAPIVVSRPPSAVPARSVASFSAFAQQALAVPRRSLPPRPAALQADLWGDARSALFEYSRLAQRYGQLTLTGRSGLDDQ